MMLRRAGVFAVILLICCAGIFPQENSDRVLARGVEEYLNKMCSLGRIFLNIVAEKVSRPDDAYIRIDKDVTVVLDVNHDISIGDIDIGIYIDLTNITNSVIYASLGYITTAENEAELVGGIIHELAHLSSWRERVSQAQTDKEAIAREIAVDKIAILVLKEMGYKPSAVSDSLDRLLRKYSDRIIFFCPKFYLVYRVQEVKKFADKILKSENPQKYREYLFYSKLQFKAMKEIVKHLQGKQPKDGSFKTKENIMEDMKKLTNEQLVKKVIVDSVRAAKSGMAWVNPGNVLAFDHHHPDIKIAMDLRTKSGKIFKPLF